MLALELVVAAVAAVVFVLLAVPVVGLGAVAGLVVEAITVVCGAPVQDVGRPKSVQT